MLKHAHWTHSDGVPVDEDVVEGEIHDEVDQRLLDARRSSRILATFAFLATKETDCICRLPVRHSEYLAVCRAS